jgi:putative Mg2+ transporter-C (MgtC) family protein
VRIGAGAYRWSTYEMHLEVWETVLRLGLALIFGAAIGWEREAKHRPAGLRTHMLVALGAAGFTLVTMELLEALRTSPVPYDPIRIVAAIVGGVGFLGAGAIMQFRGEVVGLTTAASLWVVAAMGIAFGCGFYLLALLLSGFALITLTAVKVVQRRFFADSNHTPPATTRAPKQDDPPRV